MQQERGEIYKDEFNGFGHVSEEERSGNSELKDVLDIVERGEHCGGTLLKSFERKAESLRAVISIWLAKHRGSKLWSLNYFF